MSGCKVSQTTACCLAGKNTEVQMSPATERETKFMLLTSLLVISKHNKQRLAVCFGFALATIQSSAMFCISTASLPFLNGCFKKYLLDVEEAMRVLLLNALQSRNYSLHHLLEGKSLFFVRKKKRDYALN